jgi:hypothetical protein
VEKAELGRDGSFSKGLAREEGWDPSPVLVEAMDGVSEEEWWWTPVVELAMGGL